jgi:hypothetical protein
MKSGPYGFHERMKSDPHPPSKQVMDVKSTGLWSGSQLEAPSYQKYLSTPFIFDH